MDKDFEKREKWARGGPTPLPLFKPGNVIYLESPYKKRAVLSSTAFFSEGQKQERRQSEVFLRNPFGPLLWVVFLTRVTGKWLVNRLSWWGQARGRREKKSVFSPWSGFQERALCKATWKLCLHFYFLSVAGCHETHPDSSLPPGSRFSLLPPRCRTDASQLALRLSYSWAISSDRCQDRLPSLLSVPVVALPWAPILTFT